MKKIFGVDFMLGFFQLVVFSAYITLRYFTNAKMGMRRYIIHVNRKLNEMLPSNLLMPFVLVLILLIAIMVFVNYFINKKAGMSRGAFWLDFNVLILSLMFLGLNIVILSFSCLSFRLYYFFSIALFLIYALQSIRCMFLLKRGRV